MQIVRRSTLWFTLVVALVVGGGVGVIGAGTLPYGWALGVVVAGLVVGVGLRRPLRRWRVAQQTLPDADRQWLADRVPLVQRLDAAARTRFERDVRFVLDEYTFEGVQDVDVTQTLRLSVAAGIATLLHGRPEWELPGTRSVLFYPDRFDDDYYGGDYADYDGMAHEQGPIILSALAVEDSWAVADDGDNVVLHELAHLFDFANEGPDGVPSLVDRASADSWQALVRDEMRRVRSGRSILRPYAAEAPSEFFAVAVEVFFEQPHRMAHRHAALFEAMTRFFQLDPRTGTPPPRPDGADDGSDATTANGASGDEANDAMEQPISGRS